MGLMVDMIMLCLLIIFVIVLWLMVLGELFMYLGVLVVCVLVGLIVGGSIGFVFGVVNGVLCLFEMLIDIMLQMICNILYFVLILLVILWFGIGEGVKLFFVVFGVFFLIYLNMLYGICNVDFQLIEMGWVYGMILCQLFCCIVLLGVLFLIFVGLCYGLGIMWLMLIVVEILLVLLGFGYMVMQVCEFMIFDVVVLLILFYVVFGKLVDILICVLECCVLKWSFVYVGC